MAAEILLFTQCVLAFFFAFLFGFAGFAMLNRYDQPGTGFLLGFFLGPIGILIAWIMRDDEKLTALEEQSEPSQPFESQRNERQCPYCAELILVEAKICKHCHSNVEFV